MTLRFISLDSFPAYIALSTDVDTTGSSIVGGVNLGKTIYLTDSQAWYIATGSLSGSSMKIEKFLMPKAQA